MNLQTTYKNLNGILTEEIGWKIQWCYRQSYLLDCVLAADNEANFFFVLQRVCYMDWIVNFIRFFYRTYIIYNKKF